MENDSKKINFRCFICGGADSIFFTEKQSQQLYKCRKCGLIFVYPLSVNPSGIYTKDYFLGARSGFGYANYEEDKTKDRFTLNLYLEKVEKFVPQRGKLLDVGAATGVFLELAAKRGWEVSGVEISDYAAEAARRKNLNVQTGTIESLKSTPNYFEVVTMFDVLEHLTDPQKVLRAVHYLLKPGGITVINTPDAGSFFARLMGRSWHLLVPPEHLFYFNVANLTQLLIKTGFDVRLVTNIGKRFTLRYIFKTLARWQKFFLWQWIARKLLAMPLGQFTLPLNLRDNCFIIAQKPIRVSP